MFELLSFMPRGKPAWLNFVCRMPGNSMYTVSNDYLIASLKQPCDVNSCNYHFILTSENVFARNSYHVFYTQLDLPTFLAELHQALTHRSYTRQLSLAM